MRYFKIALRREFSTKSISGCLNALLKSQDEFPGHEGWALGGYKELCVQEDTWIV